MILQNKYGQEDQEDGKKKMDIRKGDKNGIKTIIYIFGHGGNLADNNDGKN